MKELLIYDVKQFKTIKEMIENAGSEFAERNAFVIKHKDGKKVSYENITYERFLREVNCIGTAMIDMGLKNKKIAIIGKNRYEWVLTFASTLCGVGIAVPLDKGLPDDEIEMSLKKSEAEVIVCEENYIDTVRNLMLNEGCSLENVICMDEIDNNLTIKGLIEKGEELLEKGDRRFIDSEINLDDVASIVFTSGTTALSKAVMLTQKNIISNINSMNTVERMYETDTNIAFLPFHHTFGSTAILLFLSKGARNVFCDGLRHVQENLKEYKVSVFVCVPLLIEAMHKKIEEGIRKKGKTRAVKFGLVLSRFLLKFGIDIRRKLFKDVLAELGGELRFIVCGASALDKNVEKAFNDYGILTIQGYGLTEASPVVAAESINVMRYGSIGYPLPDVEVKIDSPNEEGIGEIVVKGPNIMLGYYKDEKTTAEVLKDGWYYTGDLGYKDKDGFIFVTGREKNVIVLKNGKNVYPEEIESLINNLPYVAESMVFGEPKGDDLVVSVKIVYNKEYVADNYKDLSEEDFRNIVWQDIKKINTKLPKYKYMKKLILTDEPMVKTTTQKVKRNVELKKMQDK